MRIVRIAMAVPVLALGLFAGCNDEPKEVPFKQVDTNTKPFNDMKDQMTKNLLKKGGKLSTPKKASSDPAAPAPAATPDPAK